MALCTVMSMVQLPDPGTKPMPNEYTPPPTLPNVPQVFVAGAVAVRPAGMLTLPLEMNAELTSVLLSVSVISAFTPGNTLAGAKLTDIDGVAAAAIVMLSPWLPVPLALVALTVAAKVPAADGVPVIWPVPALTPSPAGKPVAPKLTGVFVASIWYVKAVPTVPLAVAALVTIGAGTAVTVSVALLVLLLVPAPVTSALAGIFTT